MTINSLYLYIPSLVPSPEQQQIFNESIKSSSTLSFHSWVTARQPVNTGNDYQLDIGSAPNINVPLYLITAHGKTQCDNPARPQISIIMQFSIMLILKDILYRVMVLDILKIQSNKITQNTNI